MLPCMLRNPQKVSVRAISREAAKRRRRVESDMFEDLSRLLPLQPSVGANLDKPSVIRLTLSYIRMHTLLKERRGDSPGHGGDKYVLSILEGFLMVLSAEGDMIYLSDNISKYMGLTQTELMGHNIFDLTHPCDHGEIRNNLRMFGVKKGVWCGAKRDFVMRIKSTLTHRERSANLKSATWKILHCQGRVKLRSTPSSASCLLLTCRPLPLSHTLLSTHTFTSQHNMDMRFTYCDQGVTLLLGYSPEELLGRSIYDLCHTLDTSCLTKNHLNLCLKSQSASGQYRMLVRGGGYVWVESHSAVIPIVRPSKSRLSSYQPLCILCVTYVLRCVCVCVDFSEILSSTSGCIATNVCFRHSLSVITSQDRPTHSTCGSRLFVLCLTVAWSSRHSLDYHQTLKPNYGNTLLISSPPLPFSSTVLHDCCSSSTSVSLKEKKTESLRCRLRITDS
uniref:Endothelial PAS domain-containing protein 1-like n=1 Tax=Scophthalmus maximus TaxID=52904 RepID=A0A8D2ZUR8_SCOMX